MEVLERMTMKITKGEVMNITSRIGIIYSTGKRARLLTNLYSSINFCAFLLVSILGRFKELSISGYPVSQDFKHTCQQIFAHSQRDHNP